MKDSGKISSKKVLEEFRHNSGTSYKIISKNKKNDEEEKLYQKITEHTGLSKSQVARMPIKELNSFLKTNNCSDKIKDDVKILRRTLRNRGYAKKRRNKLNEEAEWYQEKV